MNTRQQNRRYIASVYLKQWPALLFGAAAVIFVAVDAPGRWGTALLAVVVVTATLIVSRRIALTRAAKILRQENVDDAIALMRKALPAMLSDRDAFLVAEAARLRLMWGDTTNADRDMQTIAWSERSPLVRAETQIYQALRAYFAGDASAGVDHARQAVALADLPTVPGAATVRANLQLYVDIGDAWSQANPEAAERLQRALTDKRPAYRLIAAWALGNASTRRGENGEAYFSIARSIAPHAMAISRLAGSAEVVPTTAPPLSTIPPVGPRRWLRRIFWFYAVVVVLWLMIWLAEGPHN